MTPLYKSRLLNTTSIFSLAVFAVGVSLPFSPVYAACSDPVGNEGDMVYNTSYDVMMFCDGSDQWISMAGGSGGGGSDTLSALSCSTNQIAKWNGSAWACAADNDTGSGSNCASSSSVTLDYDSYCGDTASTTYNCPAVSHYATGTCTKSNYDNAYILCVNGTRVQLPPLPDQDTVSCSKILCTYYNGRGMLPDRILEGDLAYATTIPLEIGRAYRAWAKPLIGYLKKNEGGWVDRFMHGMVTSWANEMAYRTGHAEKGSLIGRILSVVGEPLHYVAGRFLPADEYEPFIRMSRDSNRLRLVLAGETAARAGSL